MSNSTSTVRGWTVTIAALVINLAAGNLYAWGVLGKAAVNKWGWTRTQAAMPFALATATFAITMIFAGRLQDKLGPRRIALLGGLVMGGGFLWAGQTQAPAVLSAAYALVGVGIGLAYAATTPAAIKWHPTSRRGLITGLVVSGVGLAAVYAAPLTQWLLGGHGISGTFTYLGWGTIVVIALAAMVVTNPPAGYVAPASGKSMTPTNSPASPLPTLRQEMDWPAMLKTGRFYLLWLIFVLAAAPGLLMISNIVLIAEKQAAWKSGFVAVMLLAAMNAAGRIVSGWISDRLGRRGTMLLVFLLQAANMALFGFYTTPALIIIGVAVCGICYGAIFALMPAAAADFYGVKNLGVNYGLLFTAFGVAGTAGSLLGGKVGDVFKTYQPAYWIVTAMLLLAALLTIPLASRRTA